MSNNKYRIIIEGITETGEIFRPALPRGCYDFQPINIMGLTKGTLHDLAKKYDISAERVRQLEKNAMQKIREEMETT